jgi:glutaconate CoA-transferase subunit A
MSEGHQKIMSAREAMERFVPDGCHLAIGNYTVGSCMELIFELVRQGKKGLTVYSQSGVIDVEVLVAGGCVDRLVSTYVYRGGGRTGGSAVERALQNHTLEIEDYTNFEYNARLVAGMHGFTFMPVLEGVRATDLFVKRTFMGDDKYRVITCPYTGKEILTVPAANPDVCIVHVQRADASGNAQYWGALGSVAAAALASKRIVVSCEQIVSEDIIQSSPHLTIIPAYRVDAVIEMPWGAHPMEVLGHYNRDIMMYSLFAGACGKADKMKDWMDQWVYGCKDREAYLGRYTGKYGMHILERLRTKPYYSAPADYGAAFTSMWDGEGRERNMGVTEEELEAFLKENGALYA